MESEESIQKDMEEKQNGESFSSPVQEMPISVETPDTDAEKASPFKIPLITIDNRLIATLVETSDTEQSTDIDFTPSQEKSYTDIVMTKRLNRIMFRGWIFSLKGMSLNWHVVRGEVVQEINAI